MAGEGEQRTGGGGGRAGVAPGESEAGAQFGTGDRYELRRGDALIAIPGFNPVGVYEAAIANLAPDLARHAKPESVADLLDWAGDEPLATAEVAEIMELDHQQTRFELAKTARPEAAGADF